MRPAPSPVQSLQVADWRMAWVPCQVGAPENGEGRCTCRGTHPTSLNGKSSCRSKSSLFCVSSLYRYDLFKIYGYDLFKNCARARMSRVHFYQSQKKRTEMGGSILCIFIDPLHFYRRCDQGKHRQNSEDDQG